MIDGKLRDRLVDILLRVPLVHGENDVARTSLLAGVPNSGFFQRVGGNPAADLKILVLQLEDNFSAVGEWRLLYLIDNALPTVKGSDVAQDLQSLRSELEACCQQPLRHRPYSFDVGEIYRFDLKNPILQCLATLHTNRPKLAGYLLPYPSQRLLRCFCENLKRSGAENDYWSRGQVTIPPFSPMVLDPRYLTVERAIDKIIGCRRLLESQTVLIGIRASNKKEVSQLWESLCQKYSQPLSHHLIIVVGAPPTLRPPSGVNPVPPPSFSGEDVSKWVGGILAELPWHKKDTLVAKCINVIVTSSTSTGNQLDVDQTYGTLEYFLARLGEFQQDEEAFLSQLEQIGDSYAQS